MPLLRTLLVLVFSLGAVLALAAPAFAQEERPRVLAVEFENDVNPVTADYVVDAIEDAEEGGYDAVVILLDTPGGLSEAMRDIYQRMLASPLPVIVYVSPDGARAASAGVWIVQAADIAAMAPQTNHRLLDADCGGRRGHPGGSQEEGRERRGGVPQSARGEPRAQRRVGGESRDGGGEPDGHARRSSRT